MSSRPEPALVTAVEPGVDELLVTLGHAGMLAVLEISATDIEKGRTDPTFIETLTIAHEFLMALKDSGVIEIFDRLQRSDQAYFLRVIGMTDGEKLRRQRTATLVSALTMSPLAGPPPGTRG